jgi:hypothetical protein
MELIIIILLTVAAWLVVGFLSTVLGWFCFNRPEGLDFTGDDLRLMFLGPIMLVMLLVAIVIMFFEKIFSNDFVIFKGKERK